MEGVKVSYNINDKYGILGLTHWWSNNVCV